MQLLVLRIGQPEIEGSPSRLYAGGDMRQRMSVGDPAPTPCHLKKQSFIPERDRLPRWRYEIPLEEFALPSIRMTALERDVHRVPPGARTA